MLNERTPYMKAKKLISFILCIAIMMQLFVLPASAADYSKSYQKKLTLLTDMLYGDSETIEAIKGLDRAVVIFSVSDGKHKAKVFYSSTAKLEDSIKKASDKLKKSGVLPKWLRLDVMVSAEEKSYADYKAANATERTCIMRDCISFNSYYGTLLTESQINAAGMTNPEDGSLDLGKVNKELAAMGKKKLAAIPEKLYTFKTQGYFVENNSFAYKLVNGSYMNQGRRTVSMDRNYIQNLAGKTSSYLADICDRNGKFVYGYYPIDNKEIEGYNIIRHAGTVWNLILQYEMTGDESLVPVIDSAMNYLTSSIQYKDNQTAFVIDGKTLNIGGNGIALLAYCAYAELFGSSRYNKVIDALANGIIFMQKDNGCFVHSINKTTYAVEKEFIVVFYDGEAMFGLLRAYELLGRNKYLQSAKKAADYFIDNNYKELHSHWLSYGFNELTKYDHSEKYFEFALRNVNDDSYTKKLYNTIGAAHTSNETLNAAFETYQRLIDGGYKCDYLSEFDAEMLIKAIRRRTFYGQNYFMFPEYAMYFVNPQIVLNSFAVREDSFRIRIDDIQHFMGGYYMFWKNYDKISSYEVKS